MASQCTYCVFYFILFSVGLQTQPHLHTIYTVSSSYHALPSTLYVLRPRHRSPWLPCSTPSTTLGQPESEALLGNRPGEVGESGPPAPRYNDQPTPIAQAPPRGCLDSGAVRGQHS
jgi:hypothetical protein